MKFETSSFVIVCLGIAIYHFASSEPEEHRLRSRGGRRGHGLPNIGNQPRPISIATSIYRMCVADHCTCTCTLKSESNGLLLVCHFPDNYEESYILIPEVNPSKPPFMITPIN